jgi:DNA adenine methylase
LFYYSIIIDQGVIDEETQTSTTLPEMGRGKRQLLPVIRQYVPKKFNIYYEPFLGAGAVLFDIQPSRAIVNDANRELINCYQVIKDSPEALIADLKKHENNKDYFYALRDLDRNPEYRDLSPVIRASRIIYLNKTCFNGLFRVNSEGQFNVPFGHYAQPRIVDETVLMAVHTYLQAGKITLGNTDFELATETAKKGDFIYFDPPYDPLSETSSFTGYNLNGFGKADQVRLKETFERLSQKGCKVLLSNSATDFICDLYRDFKIIRVPANRSINSIASGRGKIDEVLVMNYE